MSDPGIIESRPETGKLTDNPPEDVETFGGKEERFLSTTIPITPISSFSRTPFKSGTHHERIELDEDKTHLFVSSARLRRFFRNDEESGKRRELVLAVGHEAIENPYRLPPQTVSRHAESLAKDLFRALEDVVMGVPTKPDTEGRVGYCLHSQHYQKLKDIMNEYLDRAIPYLRNLGTMIPAVPIWGADDDPTQAWEAGDFEILAVLFFEEVENFVGYLYQYNTLVNKAQDQERQKGKGKGKEKRKDEPATFPRMPSEGIFQSTPKEISDQARAEEGKRTIDITREAIKEYSLKDIPPHIRYKEIEPDEGGFESARKRQSKQQYGSKKGRNSLSTYSLHPVHLTESNRLSDLFEDPDPTPRKDQEYACPHFRSSAKEDVRRETHFHSESEEEEAPITPRKGAGPGPPGGGGESPDDSDSDKGEGPRRPRKGGPFKYPEQSYSSGTPLRSAGDKEPHFDTKLKSDIVPKWDGDPDTLAKWILKINNLSERSTRIYTQLGEIVPTRLEKDADLWFWSLPVAFRRSCMKTWGTLRNVICSYYMNRAWLNHQKSRENRACFRESGHTFENPSSYFIRKSELLGLVYRMSDSEIMMEVMNGAPKFWATVIDTHRCSNLVDFSSAIKYHEEVLENTPFQGETTLDRRIRNLEQIIRDSRGSGSHGSTATPTADWPVPFKGNY